jgi:hypothetical protein
MIRILFFTNLLLVKILKNTTGEDVCFCGVV